MNNPKYLQLRADLLKVVDGMKSIAKTEGIAGMLAVWHQCDLYREHMEKEAGKLPTDLTKWTEEQKMDSGLVVTNDILQLLLPIYVCALEDGLGVNAPDPSKVSVLWDVITCVANGTYASVDHSSPAPKWPVTPGSEEVH